MPAGGLEDDRGVCHGEVRETQEVLEMSEVRTEWTQQLVSGWQRELEADSKVLREHFENIGLMECTAQGMAELLLQECELAIPELLALSRALREWERFDDHDTSRGKRELREHLEAELAVAEAFKSVFQRVSLAASAID